MYRDFFGLKEAVNVPVDKLNDPEIQKLIDDPDQEVNVKDTNESSNPLVFEELDEAQLVNNMTDYRGGIQYKLRDPAMAQNVAHEIKNFAAKKKIYPIKHMKTRDGRFGYFHFRLGDDPARESQQLQGYVSQKPEIAYFRFKVIEPKSKKQVKRKF
jgi:hypothetical protein